MKKLNVFAASLLFAASLFVFTSCEDDVVVVPNTITDVVIAGADFSLLEAAVVHAGLGDALKGANLTVFAPTNQAFINAGFKDEAAIKAADKTAIADILRYHVLAGKTLAADIKVADNQELTMLSTVKAFLTKDANGVSINGAKVTKADVAADNGVIHVIDAVITPPSKNIVALAQAVPDLSLLVVAVLRANEGKTKVVTVLSGAGPFTVFAPTNKAFKDAGFDEAKLKAADPDFLATILTYHTVAARVFSTNLKTGNVKTLEGREVAIDAVKATVKGGLNTMASNVAKANVIATNGVVHVIDAVLLPK